jgi:hypothetical protein
VSANVWKKEQTKVAPRKAAWQFSTCRSELQGLLRFGPYSPARFSNNLSNFCKHRVTRKDFYSEELNTIKNLRLKKSSLHKTH